MIAAKYRYLHPSMVGVTDLNVSSNSDVGLSGSFTPYVKLYDGYYFTPDPEPCQNRYLFDKSLREEHGMHTLPDDIPTDTFEHYINALTEKRLFVDDLQYAKIEIIEKEPDPNTERMKPIYG